MGVVWSLRPESLFLGFLKPTDPIGPITWVKTQLYKYGGRIKSMYDLNHIRPSKAE